jgi:hypothetical protein
MFDENGEVGDDWLSLFVVSQSFFHAIANIN